MKMTLPEARVTALQCGFPKWCHNREHNSILHIVVYSNLVIFAWIYKLINKQY
jgi:hypothetical protein